MQCIPHEREDRANDEANASGDAYQDAGRSDVERFDMKRRGQEVKAEDEIEKRLRPPHRDEHRPHHMHCGNKKAHYEPYSNNTDLH
jgi:hypothetical protein